MTAPKFEHTELCLAFKYEGCTCGAAREQAAWNAAVDACRTVIQEYSYALRDGELPKTSLGELLENLKQGFATVAKAQSRDNACPLCKLGVVNEGTPGYWCSRRYDTENPCDWESS